MVVTPDGIVEHSVRKWIARDSREYGDALKKALKKQKASKK
jgi:hypothetical protein